MPTTYRKSLVCFLLATTLLPTLYAAQAPDSQIDYPKLYVDSLFDEDPIQRLENVEKTIIGWVGPTLGRKINVKYMDDSGRGILITCTGTPDQQAQVEEGLRDLSKLAVDSCTAIVLDNFKATPSISQGQRKKVCDVCRAIAEKTTALSVTSLFLELIGTYTDAHLLSQYIYPSHSFVRDGKYNIFLDLRAPEGYCRLYTICIRAINVLLQGIENKRAALIPLLPFPITEPPLDTLDLYLSDVGNKNHDGVMEDSSPASPTEPEMAKKRKKVIYALRNSSHSIIEESCRQYLKDMNSSVASIVCCDDHALSHYEVRLHNDCPAKHVQTIRKRIDELNTAILQEEHSFPCFKVRVMPSAASPSPSA